MIINVSSLLFLFIYGAGTGNAEKLQPEKHGHRTAATNAKDIHSFFTL